MSGYAIIREPVGASWGMCVSAGGSPSARPMVVAEQTQGVMPRDAAYDALTVFTREAYENETYRNNAEATLDATHANGYFRYSIRMVKPIQKGEEILCTYGWNFHERTRLDLRTILAQTRAT